MPLIRCHILMALCIMAVGCNTQDNSNVEQDNSDVEMVSWETQSWKTSGGSRRLSIWADGRNEVTIVPTRDVQRNPKLRARDGWVLKCDKEGVHFVRTNMFSVKTAKEKSQKALAAGIRLLESFNPDYQDGGGTAVGVQLNGELNTKVIPFFPEGNKGTANHKRFEAVSEALSDFDTKAYDTQP